MRALALLALLAAASASAGPVVLPAAVDAAGNYVLATPVIALNPDGSANSGASQTYNLASNVASLASAAGTAPVTGLVGGTYVLSAQFTGASVVLQALGPDGATWVNVTTLSAPGTTGVVIGTGATVRIYNPNGAAVTAVYASLT